MYRINWYIYFRKIFMGYGIPRNELFNTKIPNISSQTAKRANKRVQNKKVGYISVNITTLD